LIRWSVDLLIYKIKPTNKRTDEQTNQRNMKYADLHIHTKFSDGTFTPERVVKEAGKEGLSCIAITDHDQVSGIEPAQNCAVDFAIEVVPGVELSAEIDNCEIHILGYFIDWRQDWFRDRLRQICDARKRRALAIIERLKTQGINLEPAQVFGLAGTGAVGRLHIARILKREGLVQSIQEAFNKYIGNGQPSYVKKFKLTVAEAIDMIRKLKGLAVLAHPHTINDSGLIPELVRLGLRGIEVYYPGYAPATTKHYENLAREYGLLLSGGSDCHGLSKNKASIGEVKIPYSLVEVMKRENG